jgi:hypothetical protein
MRDEMLVTGVTLFTNMYLRINNIFQLFGAIAYRPDHAVKKEIAQQQAKGLGKEQASVPTAV